MYKLPHELKIIASPFVLIFPDGHEEMRSSGAEELDKLYDKPYLIDKVTAQESTIYVKLKVNDRVNDITWIGEESVSFTE